VATMSGRCLTTADILFSVLPSSQAGSHKQDMFLYGKWFAHVESRGYMIQRSCTKL
jgi:hypothetical protein